MSTTSSLGDRERRRKGTEHGVWGPREEEVSGRTKTKVWAVNGDGGAFSKKAKVIQLVWSWTSELNFLYQKRHFKRKKSPLCSNKLVWRERDRIRRPTWSVINLGGDRHINFQLSCRVGSICFLCRFSMVQDLKFLGTKSEGWVRPNVQVGRNCEWWRSV